MFPALIGFFVTVYALAWAITSEVRRMIAYAEYQS